MPTEEPQRASPEALLALAKREGRGRLKIFLGAAPGVGKTYAMLAAARLEKASGRDVAVGLVPRPMAVAKPKSCSKASKSLPRCSIVYRNRVFHEFDIDAALARRPNLLLVDEYAHTNVPGSRHPKRWHDVDELLKAGINVWTTLNIQHLESLNDVIQRITHVRVRETVPDSVFDEAYEIVLVDIPPDELLKRLAEGKVYVQDTAARAVQNFFKPQNLTASARTGPAPRRRMCGRRSDRADAGPGHRRAMGGGRAHPGLRRSGPERLHNRAHGPPAGRRDGRAMDRRDDRAPGPHPEQRGARLGWTPR